MAPASCAYTVIVDDLDSGFVATVNDPVYPHWGEVYAAYPACYNGHQYFAVNQAAYH